MLIKRCRKYNLCPFWGGPGCILGLWVGLKHWGGSVFHSCSWFTECNSTSLMETQFYSEGRAEYKSFPPGSVRASEWCSALFTRAANLLAATSKLYSPVPIKEDNVAVEPFEWSATTNSVAIQRLVGNQLLGPLSIAMTSRPERESRKRERVEYVVIPPPLSPFHFTIVFLSAPFSRLVAPHLLHSYHFSMSKNSLSFQFLAVF